MPANIFLLAFLKKEITCYFFHHIRLPVIYKDQHNKHIVNACFYNSFEVRVPGFSERGAYFNFINVIIDNNHNELQLSL